MKSLLVASVAALALSAAIPGKAHALIPVVDGYLAAMADLEFVKMGEQVINTAQTVANTAQTVLHVANVANGVAHGNVFGAANLLAELGGPDLTAPLGKAQTMYQMVSGVGNVNSVSSALAMAQPYLSRTQVYRPTGQDPNAIAMRERSVTDAGMLALANRSLESSDSRFDRLAALRSGIRNTADVKDAVDASNTVMMEVAQQTAQANQITALRMLRDAERDTQQSLTEQRWRQSADQLGQSAEAAAARAKSGEIVLVSQ